MCSLAFLLARLSAIQKVGPPGVEVVSGSILVEERRGTNLVRKFPAGSESVFLPKEVSGFRSEALPLASVVWETLPQDTLYGQRTYLAHDGFRIQNLVVLMGRDRTSIHQPQYCLQGSGWKIDRSEPVEISMVSPVTYSLPVMKLSLSMTDQRTGQEMEVIFVYWFVADGQLTADHSTRMWWMARDLLTEATLQRWAYVICFAPCPKGYSERAYDRLVEFIQTTVPKYQLTPSADKPFAVGRR
jgi:hypothetical protein